MSLNMWLGRFSETKILRSKKLGIGLRRSHFGFHKFDQFTLVTLTQDKTCIFVKRSFGHQI